MILLIPPLPMRAAYGEHKHRPSEKITVRGLPSTLQAKPRIGGRLGLTVQHNPASISVVRRQIILRRGYQHVQDALQSVAGTTVGGSPGDPAQVMMRGFGGNQIKILRDGIYFGPTTMVNRPQNTFNLQAVEVIKGPSSVFYGQGAVGGTITTRTRDPKFDKAHWNTLLLYGRFHTMTAGIGGSIPLSATSALRVDFSRTASNGYVARSDPHSNDLTATYLWRPSRHFSARLSTDYLVDKLSTYYGTPLADASAIDDRVSGLIRSSEGAAISRRSLWHNYNVRDARATSTSVTPTLNLRWKVSPRVTLENKSYFLYAQRRWNNAETYTFINKSGALDANGQAIPPGRIGRDRFYVYQNQHQVGDTLTASVNNSLLGRDNHFVVGADAYYLRFIRNTGSPNATYADSVAFSADAQGLFGSFAGEYPSRKSPTTLSDEALFFEDSLHVIKDLRFVVGGRLDWLRLSRENFFPGGGINSATSFTCNYHPATLRVGPVYDLSSKLSLYGNFSTAQDPPGSNIFIANRGQLSALAKTMQGEVGLKGHFLHNKLITTLAFYTIERRHILVQTTRNSVALAGKQMSRGVEWEGIYAPDTHLSLTTNLAYTDARYGRGFRPSASIDASGNEVPNVPKFTANAWAVWSNIFDRPFDLGGGVHYVSARKGNYANTLTLDRYVLLNTYVAWHVSKHITLYGRVDNLTDKTYVQWADTSYPSEVLLGAPRTYSFSLQAGF